MAQKQMNERAIQRALYWRRRASAALLLPNYTPAGWWECDLWLITKARYFYEFEIKLSRSDLRADARKGGGVRWTHVTGRGYKKTPRQTKYEAIERADPKSPCRFWYVVPPSLADEAFPDWAGVSVANEINGRIVLREQRSAPRRHDHRAEQRVIDHARSVCYHRYWTEIMRSDRREATTA